MPTWIITYVYHGFLQYIMLILKATSCNNSGLHLISFKMDPRIEKPINNPILVHISRVNLEEHSTKVEMYKTFSHLLS